MNELLDKLSSYNIFNYLLPGIIFVVAIGFITNYSCVSDNLLIDAFLYYFIGSVISRIGSLIIEPVFKKISFLKFAPYSDFVSASKADPKLEVLSEANNMYRTFSALFALLLLLKFYSVIEIKFLAIKTYNPYTLIVLLLIMFLCAYRKQTKYITGRIESILKNKKI